MRILAAMLQVEVNPVQNASFVLVSSGFGEFETGLFRFHNVFVRNLSDYLILTKILSGLHRIEKNMTLH